MSKEKLYGTKFYGEEISEYGIANRRVDYGTLARLGDMALCNNIPKIDPSIWDNLENGELYDEETDEYYDIYQYWIIDNYLASVLQDCTDEIVMYSELLDCYIWGITHFGTDWSYVLTDIEVEITDNEQNIDLRNISYSFII